MPFSRLRDGSPGETKIGRKWTGRDVTWGLWLRMEHSVFCLSCKFESLTSFQPIIFLVNVAPPISNPFRHSYQVMGPRSVSPLDYNGGPECPDLLGRSLKCLLLEDSNRRTPRDGLTSTRETRFLGRLDIVESLLFDVHVKGRETSESCRNTV